MVCIDMYVVLRVVRSGPFFRIAGEAWPGLPAGCIWADCMVRIYCLDAFQKVVAKHPRVDFDFYVDDFCFASAGPAERVGRDLVEAGRSETLWRKTSSAKSLPTRLA